MKTTTKELLVGIFVIGVVALGFVFAWFMGGFTPFSDEVRFGVLYSFAGGVEVGSPVRVGGVKVGRVDRIEFLPSEGLSTSTAAGMKSVATDATSNGATLKVSIRVSKVALDAVRNDSKFYVNMAGIIGERYIEISSGSKDSPKLVPGATVRGVDPPRIDQLLSQGYGVFGRIQELLEENEDAAVQFMKSMNVLLNDANRFLKGTNHKKIAQLIEALTEVATDLKTASKGLNDPDTKKAFKLMLELLNRVSEIDKGTVKKFFQEEGIRARIF